MKDIFRFYKDAACTQEAELMEWQGETMPMILNDEPLKFEDESKTQTIYVKFVPLKPTHVFEPDGRVKIEGNAILVEGQKPIPRRVRAGEVFPIEIEWHWPENATYETSLDPLGFKLALSGRLVVPVLSK